MLEYKKYKDFLDVLPEVVLEFDENGNLTYVNLKATEISGYSYDELIGMNYLTFFADEEHERAQSYFLEIVQGKPYLSGEITFTRKDGKEIPVNVSLNSRIENNKIIRINAVVIDISERKKLEEKLRKSEERLRRISDMALEGIVFHDNGRIIDANKAFTTMLGYELSEMIGTELMNIVSPLYYDLVVNYIKSRDSAPCEIKVVKKNGVVFDVEFISKSFVQEGKKLFTAVVQDISYRKKVEYMQDHDELTNLMNFRGFVRRLKEEIDLANVKNKKIAVMTIKIKQDEFNVIKNIEPELERVLLKAIPIEIAERFITVLFKEDCVARIGDDEYLSLHPLPAVYESFNTVKLINKVLNIFSEEFVRGIRLVANIGVTFYPDDFNSNNPNKIINNSRYACEEAVNQEKEYMFYNEQSHQETRERIEFIKDLIIAVKEEECKNFVLFYQPKVNREHKIMGMEALIRWKHPKWNDPNCGFVPPNRFIQTAEDLGLIDIMGKWVLREACRQTKEWQDKDERFKNLQVAVNVSPKQLNDDFVKYIEQILDETGLSSESLELEITERESVKENNARILSTIRSKNISIAIDDFGIDYSSLSKLPKLSIDTIKLDKSYIDNIANDKDYENLVNYTIEMVHEFKYKVVAEGVEEKEQVDILFNEMNCDKIQGFYFYRPLPAEEFEIKLKENLGI